MTPTIPINAVSRPIFEGEQFLNVTSGNITITQADAIMIKSAILKEISLIAWVCLIIGFSIGATAMYYYCKRKYEF